MRNTRILLVLGLSMLAGTLAAPVASAETPKIAGQVVAVAGPVSVIRPDVMPHPLRFHDNLYWRDVVEVRKEGIARVLLGGRTTVTVRELSRLELREERLAEGVRYTVDLVWGKVRASVARMLMRPGDEVEVWTRNTVASVRGTDFLVETVERPAQAGAFGLLAVRQVAQEVGQRPGRPSETVVVTLSGVVEVSNRLTKTGHVERIGAYEAVRVSGNQNPVRFQVSTDEMKAYLKGLTPPRPQEARSGDKTDAVGAKVEDLAMAKSAQSVPLLAGAGAGQGPGKGDKQDNQGSGESEENGLALGQGNGNANGVALGLTNGQGSGNGLALGLAKSPLNGLLPGKGKLGKNDGKDKEKDKGKDKK